MLTSSRLHLRLPFPACATLRHCGGRQRASGHWYGSGDHGAAGASGDRSGDRPGEVVLLTGPSGCGKTTLLTLVGALRQVMEGSVRVLGQELLDSSRRQTPAASPSDRHDLPGPQPAAASSPLSRTCRWAPICCRPRLSGPPRPGPGMAAGRGPGRSPRQAAPRSVRWAETAGGDRACPGGPSPPAAGRRTHRRP